MQSAIETAGVTAKVITPDDGHYFFGYYDLQPFDPSGKYHLCHRAAFADRIPNADDVCELGMIELETGRFIKLAETTAWNFQQGAMLQWYRDGSHILFNIREDGAYRSCILNIRTGEKRILPLPVANVSQDGKRALSINFARLIHFRPGYGYIGIPDPYHNVDSPEEDGVFVMDLETGAYRLVVSIDTIRRTYPSAPYTDGKLLINHINFNPSGTRYAMLFRNFPDKEKDLAWRTQLLTGDLEGNVWRMADYAQHSHYNWKNDTELLIFKGRKQPDLGLFLFTDLVPDSAVKLPEPNPEKDVHCLYSPNRRYIMGDGYPDSEGYRPLHFIDTAAHTDTILGRYYSYTRTAADLEFRCDLHARFDRTGRFVSFDSNHTGRRCVCVIDLDDLAGYVR